MPVYTNSLEYIYSVYPLSRDRAHQVPALNAEHNPSHGAHPYPSQVQPAQNATPRSKCYIPVSKAS